MTFLSPTFLRGGTIHKIATLQRYRIHALRCSGVSSGHIAASAGSDDETIAAKTVDVAYVSGDAFNFFEP